MAKNQMALGPGTTAPSSVRMRHALRLVALYAPIPRPVTFIGNVGSGKSTLARRIHRIAGRAGRLVEVSSGELTETLFADTLFGHVAGAFTGATGTRKGAVELADGGTLLIDDLALMHLAAQASILRVLESRRFRPLGATEDRETSARFIFASTLDLDELVSTGALLPDLRSRLGEFIVDVPSLFERVNDILPLAHKIASDFLTEVRLEASVRFTDGCADALVGYGWPGNVRQLQGVVWRALVHAGLREGEIEVRASHLPDKMLGETEAPTQGSRKLSAELVAAVLAETGGNQSEAARKLDVHRNTIARYHRSRAG